jgi:hypothetical protein
MIVRRGSRVLVALFALWSAVALTEPFQAHTCPFHDGVLAVPGAGQQHAHHESSSGEPDNPASGCHCIGSCDLQTPALLPEPSHEQLSGAFDSPSEFVSDVSIARFRPQFLLPYSLAPPVAL